jgi:hypothetical protein
MTTPFTPFLRGRSHLSKSSLAIQFPVAKSYGRKKKREKKKLIAGSKHTSISAHYPKDKE